MNTFSPSAMLSFDLETTSPNPQTARIVTSAMVRIEGRDVDAKETLADPGIPIPEGATKIHGITTEHAREHGRPHDEVLRETIEGIYKAWDDGLTLVVFNSAFDLSVLRKLDPEFVVKGPVYDPYVIDRVKEERRPGKRTLGALCDIYGIKLENAHEATSDALAAARIAWKQAKRWPDLTQMSLGDLMEYQTVGYYRVQDGLRRFLEGKGRDVRDFNTSWPMHD